LSTIKQMYAVDGSSKINETGYMTGVMDQPYIKNRDTTAGKLFFEV